MRIIAGKFRGKKLIPPQQDNIRPTLDRVKEAMFGFLQDKLYDSKVLDLFSGTGSLGIEALSRGAKRSVFVDQDAKNCELTRKNLKSLKLNPKTDYKVACSDFRAFLRKVKERFDIIFIDPPYAKGFYEPALKIIKEQNLLEPNGIIVCEHPKELNIEDLEIDFEVIESRSYGTVSLTYLWENVLDMNGEYFRGNFDVLTSDYQFLHDLPNQTQDQIYDTKFSANLKGFKHYFFEETPSSIETLDAKKLRDAPSYIETVITSPKKDN